MKKIIGIVFCVALLMLCGCGEQAEQASTSEVVETTAQRLAREIDSAYQEEENLPENSTTVGMVELNNKYTEKWAKVADEYYNKLMAYNGIVQPAE